MYIMYNVQTEKWKKTGELNKAMFEITGKENINNGKMGKVRK